MLFRLSSFTPCFSLCSYLTSVSVCISIGLHFWEHFHNSELTLRIRRKYESNRIACILLLLLIHTKWRNTQFNDALNSDSVPKCIVTFNYIRLELIARSFFTVHMLSSSCVSFSSSSSSSSIFTDLVSDVKW